MGRYFLVVEPKFSLDKYAITFDEKGQAIVDKLEVSYREITKNGNSTKIPYPTDVISGTKRKIKKNDLSFIDKMTAKYDYRDAFLKDCVDTNTYSRVTYNVHNMYIAYKDGDSFSRLDCIWENPELVESLEYASGSDISDNTKINTLIDLIGTSVNNGFIKFIEEHYKKGDTSLKGSTLEIAKRYRAAIVGMDNAYEIYERRRELEGTLHRYKEYRGMFLIHQEYQKELERERQSLEEARLNAERIANKKTTTKQTRPNQESNDDYNQLDLFSTGIINPTDQSQATPVVNETSDSYQQLDLFTAGIIKK